MARRRMVFAGVGIYRPPIIGGTHSTYSYLNQFPILPPSDSYQPADLDFIVPRVLELTYTSEAMWPWAQDLSHDGPPFSWDSERRALLRAELDAYYVYLYGLTRDDLRYVLDPADVYGEDDAYFYVMVPTGEGKDVYYEAERANIPVTLMNIDDLVEALSEHYENLDVESKQLPPLKRLYWPV